MVGRHPAVRFIDKFSFIGIIQGAERRTAADLPATEKALFSRHPKNIEQNLSVMVKGPSQLR